MKKTVALILVIIMVFAMIPAVAFAGENDNCVPAETGKKAPDNDAVYEVLPEEDESREAAAEDSI